MKRADLVRLREGRPGCPSDLALDEWVAGEARVAEPAALEAHVAACARCAERVAERRAGFAAFPETDPQRLLAGARRALAERGRAAAQAGRRAGTGRRWAWLAPLAAGCAAAAVVLVVALRPGAPPAAPPGGGALRTKGGLELRVFRLGPRGSEERLSGDRFRAGDRLRFVVDLPRAGLVAVLGVDRGGALYTAWPQAGATPAEARREAGQRQELPGAVALDAAPGPETLWLVHCPKAPGPAACAARGPDAPPVCPSGCVLRRFVLDKEP